MSELKLVIENGGESADAAKPDVSTVNPMDALNRRDIELIKKSLVGMHRDSAELRSTMVALHQRDSRMPSKSFFLMMGLLWFVGIGALTVIKPRLQQMSVFSHMSDNIATR